MTQRVIIGGVVQGVGFRWFVKRAAEKLGVRGEVWNRGDGSVEAILQHADADRVRTVIEALWSGPGAVAGVQVHEMDSHAKVYESFDIRTSEPA